MHRFTNYMLAEAEWVTACI